MNYNELIGEPIIVRFHWWFKAMSLIIVVGFLVVIVYVLYSEPTNPYLLFISFLLGIRMYSRFKFSFIHKGYFYIFNNGLYFPLAFSKGLVINKEWIDDFLIKDNIKKLLIIKFINNDVVLTNLSFWIRPFARSRFLRFNGLPILVVTTQYSDQFELIESIKAKFSAEL